MVEVNAAPPHFLCVLLSLFFHLRFPPAASTSLGHRRESRLCLLLFAAPDAFTCKLKRHRECHVRSVVCFCPVFRHRRYIKGGADYVYKVNPIYFKPLKLIIYTFSFNIFISLLSAYLFSICCF